MVNKVVMTNKRMELEREIKEMTKQLEELDKEIDSEEEFFFFYDEEIGVWYVEHSTENINMEYVVDGEVLVRSNMEVYEYYIKTDIMCKWKLSGSIPDIHLALLERRIKKVEDHFVEEGFKIFRR